MTLNQRPGFFPVEEYFGLHETITDQRLHIVGFNMDGDAAIWFRWMKRNNMITTWESFLENV